MAKGFLNPSVKSIATPLAIEKGARMSIKVGVILLLGAATGISCHARDPEKGKDFDARSITVIPGSVVEIVGTVTTKNTQSGNTSSIVLYVNGVQTRTDGGDKATSRVTHRIDKPGDYDLKTVCDNTKAEADTCVINITKVDREKF